MPVYTFQHPETEETIDLVFGMNDDKEYVDKSGVEWKRVFETCELKTQSTIDPWSSADFVSKTGDTKGNLGDLMDRSAELSQKRADSAGGVDPVKEKYYKQYSKDRKGAKHIDKMKTYETKDVKVEFQPKPKRKT